MDGKKSAEEFSLYRRISALESEVQRLRERERLFTFCWNVVSILLVFGFLARKIVYFFF